MVSLWRRLGLKPSPIDRIREVHLATLAKFRPTDEPKVAPLFRDVLKYNHTALPAATGPASAFPKLGSETTTSARAQLVDGYATPRSPIEAKVFHSLILMPSSASIWN